MRAVLAVLLLVVATLAAPTDAWSKCSVCEWLVGKLVSKGSCYGIGDACDLLPPPWRGTGVRGSARSDLLALQAAERNSRANAACPRIPTT